MDAVVSKPAEEAAEVGVGITIQSQVNGRRTIIMQTAFPRDADTKDFNVLIDKLSGLADRQEARFDLEGIKLSLEQDEKGLMQATDAYNNIEVKNKTDWANSGKRGEPKLTGQEVMAKGNHETNIKSFKAAIAKKKKEIVELEAKIAKVD